jgi:hypothetical protein
VLLIDLDVPGFQYGPIIEHYLELGAKLILYPHGAGTPVLSYDGLFEPDPRVTANLVTAVGHAELLRRLEYPCPIQAIGFYQCQQFPFKPCADVKHVVFGPTHPNGDGSMMEHRRKLNTRIFEELLAGPWQVTVRHLNSLESNGLWEAEGVTYVQGTGRGGPVFDEIDAADVVVAGEGTFPTLAIARGVPTITYGRAQLAWGLAGEEPVPPKRPERYLDYISYPLDAEDAPLEELIPLAAAGEDPVREWKRRFIGEPFNARAAVDYVERIVFDGPPPVQIDPTRAFTTVAFADELMERPDLLRTYAARFTPADDASLVLWAPGVGPDQLLAMAQAALERSGLPDDQVPDILLSPLGYSPEVERGLAARASAVLSEWPAIGPLGQVPRLTNTETSARA